MDVDPNELDYIEFQFPLHRDPRCNTWVCVCGALSFQVSVPFTSGSSLQPRVRRGKPVSIQVSVPFTSGSSLQHVSTSYFIYSTPGGFSSLYIGILAATLQHSSHFVAFEVSVPFTSGSSLQHNSRSRFVGIRNVSVPFTSGSSLQLLFILKSSSFFVFQFPLHRDPRCNIICQCAFAY